MTKEFAIEYIQEGCLSCPEYDTANKECISNSHCFEVKRYAIKAIAALKQEPCNDCISREQALKEAYWINVDGERFEVVQVETLLGVPSVQPMSVIEEIKTEIEHLACRQYEHKLTLDREEVLEIIDKHLGKEQE